MLWTSETPLHVCSIEALPGSQFIAGAYQLEEGGDTPSRVGSLTLFDAGATVERGSGQIVEIGSLATDGGVLDCKVAKADAKDRYHVVAALSTGTLQFLLYDKENHEASTGFLRESGKAVLEEEGLFLSVDWDTFPLAIDGNSFVPSKVAVSTQQSSLLVYDVTVPESPLVHIRNAHVLMGDNVPAWITTFDHFHTHVMASGGDDCCLRLWDIRMPLTGGSTLDSTFSCGEGGRGGECTAKNSKTHSSGVTSLQYHPSKEHVLASGSYDGSVRVWDCRNLKRPTGSLDTGGGVWRTKWHIEGDSRREEKEDYLVLACMHAGSHIISVKNGGGDLDSVWQFPKAEDLREQHLAYGIAMLDHEGSDKKRMLASCSFYENSVDLWEASL